jgi:anti-sigma regulatory factor (Ser/Thr protein kinase)
MNQETIENKAELPRVYVAEFDKSHFGDFRPADPENSYGFYNEIRAWTGSIADENPSVNFESSDKNQTGFNDCLFELMKNAQDYGNGKGEMRISVDSDRVGAVVSDDGEGFKISPNKLGEDPDDIHGYGLSVIKNYADEFSLETNGKKYTKVNGESDLSESDDTDITHGTRVTFVKNINSK